MESEVYMWVKRCVLKGSLYCELKKGKEAGSSDILRNTNNPKAQSMTNR